MSEYDEQYDTTKLLYRKVMSMSLMLPKAKKKKSVKKPVLVKVGRHYISPSDIRCISEVKKGRLYIVKFFSDPNPQYPCWVNPEDIGKLLEHFEIIVSDED